MSDLPPLPPPVPMMTPEQARDRGRTLQGIAAYLRDIGDPLARATEGRAMFYMTYAIALAQTVRQGGDPSTQKDEP